MVEIEEKHSPTSIHDTAKPHLSIPNCFPVDVLPPSAREYVNAISQASSAPSDLAALPVLVSLGAAVGNSRRVRLKKGWTESAALYGAIVGDPGSLKSPLLDAATAPVKKRNQDYPGGRTWSSDSTIEGLSDLLLHNPRGLVIVRDELSAWVKSLGQYKNGRGADREYFLAAWSGQPIIVDRKNAPSLHLPRPFVSIIGAITPDILPTLDDAKARNDGFVDRILFAWPNSKPVRWTDCEVSEPVRDAYFALIDSLYKLQERTPSICLDLTPEARSVWINWHDAHCQEAEDLTLSPYVKGAYAKLRGACSRFALICALATDPQAQTVDKAAVEAAIALANYFKRQIHRVATAIGRTTSDPVEQTKTAIRRALSGVGSRSMKKRDLQRKMNVRAEVFHEALEQLTKPEVIINQDLIVINDNKILINNI